jgi:fructose-bisphosphate aldolase class II
MKTLKYYLKKAHKEKFAIGQFNFSDFSQVKAIVAAAKNTKSPIILGTSEGESKFFGLKEAVALRNALRRETGLPIFLNLDHGKSFEYLKEAINAGYDMVHFDGSKLTLEENIKISKKVTGFAKRKNIVVEGEIGRIGTDASRVYQEKFEIKEADLTDPMQAKMYAQKSKVDILAISIGTFHGMDISGESPNLKLDRLREIKAKVDLPMVLHGGSGTPSLDIKEAIKQGISKININTEIRLAFSNTLRKKLEIDKNEIVPYKYLPEAMAAVQAVVEEKIALFGSTGKA